MVGDNAGIATTSNALAMIDPADIDTVEILKDGATTSIYGSRGAAGVIVIKTKSGRGGRGKLSFAAEYGLGTPSFEKFDFLNAEQQVSTLINGYIGRGSTPASAASTVESLLHWDGVTNTDWESATRRGAAGISKYNMNYSFGNDKIKGYASIGNTEQEGITRDASYKRANAMVKINAKVNDKINIAVSNVVARATQFGPLDYGYFANPILSSRFTSPLIMRMDRIIWICIRLQEIILTLWRFKISIKENRCLPKLSLLRDWIIILLMRCVFLPT